MDNDLKLTETMMESDDYKERFKAELIQTKIRYDRLRKFCNKIEAANITYRNEPKHDCPLALLREQQHIMGEYLRVLELRAVIEEIEI